MSVRSQEMCHETPTPDREPDLACLDVDARGRKAAAGDAGGSVGVYDLINGSRLASTKVFTGAGRGVVAIVYVTAHDGGAAATPTVRVRAARQRAAWEGPTSYCTRPRAQIAAVAARGDIALIGAYSHEVRWCLGVAVLNELCQVCTSCPMRHPCH